MGKKAGIWVDHRQAIIVIILDKGIETKHVRSQGEKQLRRSGDSPLKGPFEAQSVPADDRQEAKLTGYLNIYYDEVIACIFEADAILVFGPGEAKVELKKRMESQEVGKRIVGVETADKMTDQQIAAKVLQFFQERNGRQDL